MDDHCLIHRSLETKNSQHGSPFGILTAVLANAITGFLFLVAVSFMVKDFDAQILSDSAIQPQLVQVFLDACGSQLVSGSNDAYE